MNELETISRRLDLEITGLLPVGGGSINRTYCLQTPSLRLFCKINSASKFPHLFSSEAQGLSLLSGVGGVRTPAVIDQWEEEGLQFLVLNWIEEGERNDSFWKGFGEDLALLHSGTASFFGSNDDNYMGNLPQTNRNETSWVDFFLEQRLRHMVRLCSDRRLLERGDLAAFETLYTRLPQFFGADEKPALVHGDLWSGNFMCNPEGRVVLIDPAAYYGHPAVDLGMTTLFGGFHPSFYQSYAYHQPAFSRDREQWKLANLYPLLIHLYLFGSSYLGQIRTIIKPFS